VLRNILVTLALVTALWACKSKQPAAREVTPPTASEAEAFGRELAMQLAPCDPNALDRMIDLDLILARSVANRRVDSSALRGLRRGLGSLGQRMCQELEDPSLTATYLRTLTVNGSPRPVIRLLFEQGLNYYQLELDKRGEQIRVADFYLYLAGETMSDTLGGLIDLLSNTPSATSATTVTKIKQLVRAKQWQEAHGLYKTLPAALRASKPVKLLEVTIASELGDDAYVAAMDDYAKAYPDDASLALIQIDRTVLRKEYDATLAALDKIDKQVGGDPYLEVMRVDAYTSQGKLPDALAAAKRGVAAEPSLEHTWWALLTAQTATEHYADAMPTLETLRDKFGADITTDTLGGDARFGALVASDAYQAWLAR
jgi:hypothetical protein